MTALAGMSALTSPHRVAIEQVGEELKSNRVLIDRLYQRLSFGPPSAAAVSPPPPPTMIPTSTSQVLVAPVPTALQQAPLPAAAASTVPVPVPLSSVPSVHQSAPPAPQQHIWSIPFQLPTCVPEPLNAPVFTMARNLKTVEAIWEERSKVQAVREKHGPNWASMGRDSKGSKRETSIVYKRKLFWDEIQSRAEGVGGGVEAERGAIDQLQAELTTSKQTMQDFENELRRKRARREGVA